MELNNKMKTMTANINEDQQIFVRICTSIKNVLVYKVYREHTFKNIV